MPASRSGGACAKRLIWRIRRGHIEPLADSRGVVGVSRRCRGYAAPWLPGSEEAGRLRGGFPEVLPGVAISIGDRRLVESRETLQVRIFVTDGVSWRRLF